MAEEKKSFVVYSDWYGVFKEIPDDLAGKLIKHIFSYVNAENPQSDDFVINALFSQIKNTLKRDLEKWESQKKQRSDAGKRSAEKRNSTKSNDRSISLNETQRNSTVRCNMLDVNVNVNDFLLEKETKKIDLFISDEADKIPKHAERKKVAPKKEINLLFPTPEFKASWDLWKAYRKKKDKFQYFDEESEQKALTELFNLSKQNQATALAIIRQSIDKGWKGFFELKTTFTNGSTQSTLSQARRR